MTMYITTYKNRQVTICPLMPMGFPAPYRHIIDQTSALSSAGVASPHKQNLRARRRLAQRSIRNVRSAKDRSWEKNMRCNITRLLRAFLWLPLAALLALGANLAGAASPAPSGRF